MFVFNFVCLFMFLHLLIISRFCIHEHGSKVLVFIVVVATMMVIELGSRFPFSKVMDALSIVYPQF